MDSYYITATTPNPDKDNLMALINCCIRHRYDFKGLFTNYGTFQPYFPTLVVSQEDIPHINELKESTQPNIYFYIFDYKGIFARDEYYPVIENGIEYYPILGVDCRESMFSLEFILHFLRANPGTYVANVKLNILTLEQLERLFEAKNYDWAYIGEYPEPRIT